MTRLRHLFLMLLLFLAAMPSVAAGQDKGGIDFQGILWGHIKDSYEWHKTKKNNHPVVIHLPVIVNTTTGWQVY